MVKALLHVPAVRARELAASGQQEDYIRGLEAIYGLTVDQPQEKDAELIEQLSQMLRMIITGARTIAGNPPTR
jgi:hypothetical protein